MNASIRLKVSQAPTQKYIGSRFLNSLSVLSLMLSPVMSLYRAITTSMYRVISAGFEAADIKVPVGPDPVAQIVRADAGEELAAVKDRLVAHIRLE